MGNLFSQKCDLCASVQSEEEAHKIKGTSYTMNGQTRFACQDCRDILHTAFSVGAEGLRDPMKALAAVVKERDELKRLLQQSGVQREAGTVSLVGVELDHKLAQRYNQLSPAERFQAAGMLGPVGIAPEFRPKIGHTPKVEPEPEKKSGVMGKLGFNKKKKK